MRCRPGTVTVSEPKTIPDQQCTASRCTASGKRGFVTRVLARVPRRPAGQPHLLEIVEGPNFGAEDVNNHIARVDQHPVAMRYALDPGGNAYLVQVLDDPVGDGTDMALRPAGSYDHVVADRRFVSQVYGEGVLRLHIVEAGEDQTEDLLGVRTHSGDRFGRATFGPKSYRCGQGSLSFRSFLAPAIESEATTKIGTHS
jgi:hypothetical protein